MASRSQALPGAGTAGAASAEGSTDTEKGAGAGAGARASGVSESGLKNQLLLSWKPSASILFRGPEPEASTSTET